MPAFCLMCLGPFLNYEAQRATSNSMETSTEGTDPWSISARLKVDSPDLGVHPRPVLAEPQVPAPVSSLHFQICCGEWGVMLQTWEQLKIDISPNRFTCMGFLLPRKGCLPWAYDFDGPVGRMISYTCLSFVSHLSPTLSRLVA